MQKTSTTQTNIMIVDDDPEILTSLKTLFEKKNYNVTLASNGRECLNVLEQGFSGIILMDIMMPVMDGIETIKNMIREGFTGNTKIIVLTAKKIQGEEFNNIYQYIYKYINKPFDISELIKSVEEANI